MPRRRQHASGKSKRRKAKKLRRSKSTATTAPKTAIPRVQVTQPSSPITAPPAASSPDGVSSPPAAIMLQLYGCVGLCAFGAIAAIIYVIDATSIQVGSLSGALVLTVTAFVLGGGLGLWLPGRLIRPRVGADPGISRPGAVRDSGNGPDFEFAASLSGVLVLVLGLSWCLVTIASGGLEYYRMWIVDGFMFGPIVAHALLLAPLCGALVLAGISSGVTLVAIHGWQHLLVHERSSVAGLWIVLLASCAAGAGCAWVIQPSLPLAALALVATFLGGIVAVGQRPRAATAQAATRQDASIGIDVKWAATLGPVALAGVSAGAALSASTDAGVLFAGDVARDVATMTLGACIGTLAADWLVRWRAGMARAAPVGAVLLAFGWIMHVRHVQASVNDGIWLLFVAAVCAAIVASTGRMLMSGFHRPQPVLVRVGTVLVLAVVVGLVCHQSLQTGGLAAAHGVLISLLLTAGAGLCLIFAPGVARLARGIGLGGVAVCLLMMLTHSTVATPERNDLLETPNPPRVVHAARVVLADVTPQTAFVTKSCELPHELWRIDLGGPQWGLIVLRHAECAAQESRSVRLMPRIVARCTRALRTGGRLAIELPPDQTSWDVNTTMNASPRQLLEIADETASYRAVILGPPLNPAWLASQPALDEFTIRLDRESSAHHALWQAQ